MVAPKCRIDVWQPTIVNVTTAGVVTTAQRPAAWVKCDTVTDVTTEDPPGPNPNLRRGNACTYVEIKDGLFAPRVAYISIANRPLDFKAFDDETMELQHQDSDGNEIQISSSDVKTRIRRNWGPFSHFFKDFQNIRIVDLETHLVLFTGRVYKISKKHDGQRGAVVELVCKDALEELKHVGLGSLNKEIDFGVSTPRHKIIQALLNYKFNYEAAIGPSIQRKQNSPVVDPLSNATYGLNSNDNSTSTATPPIDTSYKRFEQSATKKTPALVLKPRKTGSNHLLQEITRWAILEPHEDETAENQFGYDFFVDSNIGDKNLLATEAPTRPMFNYYKRGNRLSAWDSGSSKTVQQAASTYGLTSILPTIARASHQGGIQSNVGVTGEVGNTSQTAILIGAGHSIYTGQVITVGSEKMFVKYVGIASFPFEQMFVVRGWEGTTAATFASSAVIAETRPATVLMEQNSSSFEDTRDELFTECALTYEYSYWNYPVGKDPVKLGTMEKTKLFEIMYATEISSTSFRWSGLDFDALSHPSNADTPGTDSAELVTVYRENGSTVMLADAAIIQYQSAVSVTGATNFGYILLSDIKSAFPTKNHTGQDYVTIKGNTSNATCRVNLNALDIQTGRPATAFRDIDEEKFKRQFTMTRETHENIDDIRQEVAARLAQSTTPMMRGDFNVSKAPYYWVDFKVKTIANDGSTGQTIDVKSDNGTPAVAVTNYGFRAGMLVHKRADVDGDPDYERLATVEVSGVDKDVYGYCYGMNSDSEFKVNLTESESFAVDDKIRLFIPIRAGDAMFVDDILATVYGEHLVTDLTFTESPMPKTRYGTMGENEPRIRMKVGSVNKQNIWNSIVVNASAAQERETRVVPRGHQTFSFSGTWSYPANNLVQWTAGNVRIADGETYQIVAGGTSDTTYGLGSSGMTGINQYVVYLDPDGENTSTNSFHFYTRISTSYVQDVDKIIILKTHMGDSAGANKAGAIGGPNMDFANTDLPKWEAFIFAHDDSVKASLIKATTLTGDKFVNKTITATQIGDNEISTGQIATNAISATEIQTNAITSVKILAGAIIADKIGTSAITADKIYAGTITADKIQTNTITTGQLSFTYASEINGNSGLNSDSTASIRLVANAESGTVGGLQVSASTFHMGDGHFGLSNTPFFVRGVNGTDGAGHAGTAGDFSLGDKFAWDNSASTLSIDGVLTFGGVCIAGANGIYFPDEASTDVGTVQWQHASGGGSTFIYKVASGNNLIFYAGGSSSAADKAVLFLSTDIGKALVRVPNIYVDNVNDLASGSATVPTLNFLADAGSGLGYAVSSSGAYKGVRIIGNSGYIANFWSDGSTKAISMYGFIDMNTENIANAGTIECTSLTETSDSRIKTNIQDLPNVTSLAFIDSLQPRSFNRLTNTGETVDEISYGLIAQEVEEALTGLNIDKTKLTLIKLPETETIMRETEEGEPEIEIPNPRGLSYTQLIAPLIGAIKELKARIEVLEGNG